MNLSITSKGKADTVISANGQKRTSKLTWDGDMKKGKGKLHIKMDNNGKKFDKTMNFTEQDLVKMLSVPSINQDIDQRLFNNYLSSSSGSMREPLEIQTLEFSGHPAVELGEFPEDGLEGLSTVLPLSQSRSSTASLSGISSATRSSATRSTSSRSRSSRSRSTSSSSKKRASAKKGAKNGKKKTAKKVGRNGTKKSKK